MLHATCYTIRVILYLIVSWAIVASPLATKRYVFIEVKVYYDFTTFERKIIRTYSIICEYLPKTEIPKMLVKESYNGILEFIKTYLKSVYSFNKKVSMLKFAF